jgi:hypothetical protein
MTRAELKKKLGMFRPSLVRPEMYDTISERKLARLEETALMRYEREKLAIYKNRSLTDEQRDTLWREAAERRWAAADKLRPLRRLCDRMHERRMIKRLEWFKKRPIASSRRRVAA